MGRATRQTANNHAFLSFISPPARHRRLSAGSKRWHQAWHSALCARQRPGAWGAILCGGRLSSVLRDPHKVRTRSFVRPGYLPGHLNPGIFRRGFSPRPTFLTYSIVSHVLRIHQCFPYLRVSGDIARCHGGMLRCGCVLFLLRLGRKSPGTHCHAMVSPAKLFG